MTLAQMHFLRRELHERIEVRRTLLVTAQVTAAAALLAGAAYVVWYGLDRALGEGVPAQIVSVGIALTVGAAVYAVTVLALRIPEARQIQRLLAGRLGLRGER
jgi:putative peptidoglycan lipid II flippase